MKKWFKIFLYLFFIKGKFLKYLYVFCLKQYFKFYFLYFINLRKIQIYIFYDWFYKGKKEFLRNFIIILIYLNRVNLD